MGRDKALLPYGETTLLEHALARAREVTNDLRILSGSNRRYEDLGVPVLEDVICGAGPIGGLYTALVDGFANGAPRVFWLAVDLPNVRVAFLHELIARLDEADVALPRTSRGDEPLCAAFRTEPCLGAVRRAIFEGRLKLTSALDGLRVRCVDGDDAAFLNVNTPEEYARLQEPPSANLHFSAK
jgi:molybdopterin-guanine dinucleotide biosynthesis protein A